MLGRIRGFTPFCRFLTMFAVFMLGAFTPAIAQAVQVSFEAIIVEIFDPFGHAPLTWMEGDTIRGCYEYELGAVDACPDPQIGLYGYSSPPNGFFISHKGYEYRTNPNAVTVGFEVRDEPSRDRIDFYSIHNLMDPEVLGVGSGPIQLLLKDSTATALSSDSLPTTTPDLGAWDTRKIVIFGESGYQIISDLISVSGKNPTGIEELRSVNFELKQNYPNPFNPTTTIRFHIAQPQHVTLRIYDVSGGLVRTLVDKVISAGEREVRWDGADDRGNGLASGVYFYSLKTLGLTESRKMLMLK